MSGHVSPPCSSSRLASHTRPTSALAELEDLVLLHSHVLGDHQRNNHTPPSRTVVRMPAPAHHRSSHAQRRRRRRRCAIRASRGADDDVLPPGPHASSAVLHSSQVRTTSRLDRRASLRSCRTPPVRPDARRFRCRQQSPAQHASPWTAFLRVSRRRRPRRHSRPRRTRPASALPLPKANRRPLERRFSRRGLPVRTAATRTCLVAVLPYLDSLLAANLLVPASSPSFDGPLRALLPTRSITSRFPRWNRALRQRATPRPAGCMPRQQAPAGRVADQCLDVATPLDRHQQKSVEEPEVAAGRSTIDQPLTADLSPLAPGAASSAGAAYSRPVASREPLA